MPKGIKLEWNDEMHAFCKSNQHMIRRELAEAFNARFGTDRKLSAIHQFCKRYEYNTNRNGQFVKGNVPFNAGMKGVCAAGCEVSHFKKNHRPFNALPIGTEMKLKAREGKDPGYWRVKTSEPRGWTYKHRLIWEQRNGPVPKGHAVIFVDGDVENFEPSNLKALSRGELAILNHVYQWPSVPVENRETILLMAKIDYIAGRLKRGESTNDTHNSLVKICAEKGIKYATVIARIDRGFTIQQALSA